MRASKEVPGRAARAESQSAEQLYLLGAEHAQNGEYARALEDMTLALTLRPELHTARLQLGLLLLTMGRPEQARAAWAPLQSLTGALRRFAEGLDALARGELERCIDLLQDGIALNATNPPLNNDMSLIVDRARAALADRKENRDGAETRHAMAVRTDFSLYDETPE